MDDRNLNPVEKALECETVKLIAELGLVDMLMAGVLFLGVGGSAALLYIKHILKNN